MSSIPPSSSKLDGVMKLSSESSHDNISDKNIKNGTEERSDPQMNFPSVEINTTQGQLSNSQPEGSSPNARNDNVITEVDSPEKDDKYGESLNEEQKFLEEDAILQQRRRGNSFLQRLSKYFDLSEYIKAALYGGMDGIASVFVTVTTVYSSGVPFYVVFVIGFSKLLAGAISMAVGDFMSGKAELDMMNVERKRELWECENFLKGEKDEMTEIYTDKGLSEEAAKEMVDLMSNNREAFVDVMMVQELHMKGQSHLDKWAPLKSALTNFTFFFIFGIVPLLIYVVSAILFLISNTPNSYAAQLAIFIADCVITILTFIVMGDLKGRFSGQTWYWSISTTVIIGVVAAGSGYLVAFLLGLIPFS